MSHPRDPATPDLAPELNAVVDALPDRRTAPLRALRRTWSRRLSGAGPSASLALAEVLVARGDGRRRILAHELVHYHYHPPVRRQLDAPWLERLAAGMADWAAVAGRD